MPASCTDREMVIAAEVEYLRQRRQHLGIAAGELHTPVNDTWGLAISGGGIRSATFAMGVIQSMARPSAARANGMFRQFDYMSTVSGGGYIGSVITSLLTVRQDAPLDAAKADCGVEARNFPLTSVNAQRANDPSVLTVKHQLHHLRSNGNYLAAEKGVLRSGVQRLFGTAVGGVVYNMVLFSLMYLFLLTLVHMAVIVVVNDPIGAVSSLDDNLQAVGYHPVADGTNMLSLASAEDVWNSAANVVQMHTPWTVFGTNIPVQRAFGFAAVAGCIVGLLYAGLGFRRMPNVQARVSRLSRRFMATVATLMVTGLLVKGLLTELTQATAPRHTGLWIPFVFSIGLWLPIMLASLVVMHGPECEHKRGQRSYFATLRGYSLTSILASATLPFLVVALFTISRVSFPSFILSLVALCGGAVGMKLSAMPVNLMGSVGRFVQRNPRSVLGLTVILLIAFTFAPATRFLTGVCYNGWFFGSNPAMTIGATSLALAAAILLLGLIVDSNEVSPFAFYRDRLAETYLTTSVSADTMRNCGEDIGRVKVLRDDSDLPLRDIGRQGLEDVGGAPYHLITTALNMSGARGQLRKDMKSEHFLFSRYYVGSDATGYVPTPADLTLGRAMALSGAAFSGMAGQFSFFGQRFFAVLLNARLGQWMDNPAYDSAKRRRLFKGRSHPFWPTVLIREILGMANATSTDKFINVSDGGHTGDNLGLLPLLHRRCSTIVVIDGEQDPDYQFGSLNNAIRFALVEENITVDIDLSALHPLPDSVRDTERTLDCCATGRIVYPDGNTGTLVYCKAAVTNGVPAHVENYDRRFAAFPHQSTGDQFFDTEQFEAYRALGEHVGNRLRETMDADLH